MYALQAMGVPAGVAQTTEDRFESDPQLKALKWTVELKQSEVGIWPARDYPIRFSETPSYIGGVVDRHGPSYGEDNDDVLSRILGYSQDEIDEFRKDGVL
jgi:crotonobetainyl-CoA:carnitine CoA-transferase CaiB-like acyl-CoA transferase